MALTIPRIFHQIWVGPEPVPKAFLRYQESWLDKHPGWELRFWTEDNLPSGLRRNEPYERLRVAAERSDILRYEVVWREGGVYLDMDFEALRSLEPLLDGESFVCTRLPSGAISNAFIASVPRHPILDRALTDLRPCTFHDYDKAGTGPLYFTEILERHQGATIVDAPSFFPAHFPESPRSREHAYAEHHDTLSWKYSVFGSKARFAALKTEQRLAEARRDLQRLSGELERVQREREALQSEVEGLRARSGMQTEHLEA